MHLKTYRENLENGIQPFSQTSSGNLQNWEALKVSVRPENKKNEIELKIFLPLVIMRMEMKLNGYMQVALTLRVQVCQS
jgi:hypothetical protein